jgi:hypothetical protein
MIKDEEYTEVIMDNLAKAILRLSSSAVWEEWHQNEVQDE